MAMNRVSSDENVWVLERNSENTASSCFDCNICLDSAHDPVVTLCGHLYCWPCIYKWLQIVGPTPQSEDNSKCPVCKAHISNSSLVPLYGRGTSSSLLESEPEKSQPGQGISPDIPHRPRAIGTSRPVHTSPSPASPPPVFQNYRPYFPRAFAIAPSSFGGTVMTGLFTGMFGSSGTSLISYPPHPNAAYLVQRSGSSPRMRRQEMQVDKFLNRLSVFLFCCFILCLLLF